MREFREFREFRWCAAFLAASSVVVSAGCSTEVRRKLGILKLVELRQYVPDMGVRCANDTYFITGKDMM